MKPIRIGTRGSKLALYQAHHIAGLLENRGMKTETVVIDTTGDKIQNVSIAKIGSKGVFTQELEDQLETGDIDIAVHSAKDMQSSLPEGFELIAFSEREKVNDIILSHQPRIIYDNPDLPLVIGTSSTRRIATIKHFFPHIKTVEMRGNLQTRISKMESGVCDALLLAYAGVHRMEYDHMIRQILPADVFIPAVGQGSIAVEAHAALDPGLRKKIREAAHHEETGYRLQAERSFLKVLEGGCSIPVFALGKVLGQQLSLEGGVLSLDGSKRVCFEVHGTVDEAEELGQQLAHKVLQADGRQMLDEIKKTLGK